MRKKLARVLRKWAGWLDPQGKPGRKRGKRAGIERDGALAVRLPGFNFVPAEPEH